MLTLDDPLSLIFSFIFVQIFPRCYTPIFDGLVLVRMQPVHRHRYHHHPTAARKSKPGCTLPWLIINMIGIIGGALSIPSGSTYLIFFDIIRHGLPHGPREAPVDQNGCSTEFCQIPFQPPPLKQTDALWELLFLDGILMDIMIDNGQIWCKLSALVMVYIH